MKEKSILIITGPTAVGKSDIASKLAQLIPVEIVNADVGQMYQPLTIGTAKPDWKNEPVAHHGFDLLDRPEHYTVVAYKKYIESMCQEIWARNKTPLLVGGSLFYIKSLFFPPREQLIVNTPLPLPENQSWDTLYAHDPERARTIHPHDTYRIKRAFDLWSSTGGTRPSTLTLSFKPIAHASILFLTRSNEQLYKRINERVVSMFKQGFLQEVTALQNTEWEEFLLKKKFIGYDDSLLYVQKKFSGSQDLLVQTIQQKTRHYAKRQKTFWRMLEAKLAISHDAQYKVKTKTFDLTTYDDDLYSNNLMEHIRNYVQE